MHVLGVSATFPCVVVRRRCFVPLGRCVCEACAKVALVRAKMPLVYLARLFLWPHPTRAMMWLWYRLGSFVYHRRRLTCNLGCVRCEHVYFRLVFGCHSSVYGQSQNSRTLYTTFYLGLPWR